MWGLRLRAYQQDIQGLPVRSSMGQERDVHDHGVRVDIHQNRKICLHVFSDLSRTPPATFVYLLKECYTYGTHKATHKFQLLQQEVLMALRNNPQLGPAEFVLRCLYVVPLLGSPYSEGFSHLFLLSFRRLKSAGAAWDLNEAKHLAARLFLDILSKAVSHDERILVKLLQAFDIHLGDVERALCGSEDNSSDVAKSYLEHHIVGFIESASYMTAVVLLEHFPVLNSSEFEVSFLDKMVQDKQYHAAEKWASLKGKSVVCLLIEKFLDLNLLKNAHNVIKKNNLKDDYPDACHAYKCSALKKLAEKGVWDVAEIKSSNDKELLLYLVYLAMEAGYNEKVDELCNRYSLDGIMKELEPAVQDSDFLCLSDFALDDVLWVDEETILFTATSYLESCKVIGLDCEWKPNYQKGQKPSKVSILQIASEKKVFILDMIKLYMDAPNSLDDCLRRILGSTRILKLGYNIQCDLRQLSISYGDLECFKHCDMLLDLEKLFKNSKGGLSGLAKKLLGAGLNKTRRNSNWEQRPLTQNQIEYAALDAAVLLRIFHHMYGKDQSVAADDAESRSWKSHVVSVKGRKSHLEPHPQDGDCSN